MLDVYGLWHRLRVVLFLKIDVLIFHNEFSAIRSIYFVRFPLHVLLTVQCASSFLSLQIFTLNGRCTCTSFISNVFELFPRISTEVNANNAAGRSNSFTLGSVIVIENNARLALAAL